MSAPLVFESVRRLSSGATRCGRVHKIGPDQYAAVVTIRTPDRGTVQGDPLRTSDFAAAVDFAKGGAS